MKRIVARFYRTEAGTEPVRDWLTDMHSADRKIVSSDIASVEFGWPRPMPIWESVADDLFEMRSMIEGGTAEARTYFTVDGNVMLLLHGHRSEPNRRGEFELAYERLRDHRNRSGAPAPPRGS